MQLPRITLKPMILALIHAGISLGLLLNLYLPNWAKWRQRDVLYQQHIEAQAKAGQWPPQTFVGFEVCYFGHPKEIDAMFPANLPSLAIAGVLIVPGNFRDHLLEPAPSRMLPSTRALIFITLFVVIVGLQWYVLGFLISSPRVSASWQWFTYVVPIACVPLGLVLRGGWRELFLFASFPFFAFLVARTLWLYRRPSAMPTN